MPERDVPFTHTDIIQDVQQVPEVKPACSCTRNFDHVNMEKGDRLCVLDVGGGNVRYVLKIGKGLVTGATMALRRFMA